MKSGKVLNSIYGVAFFALIASFLFWAIVAQKARFNSCLDSVRRCKNALELNKELCNKRIMIWKCPDKELVRYYGYTGDVSATTNNIFYVIAPGGTPCRYIYVVIDQCTSNILEVTYGNM